MIQFLRRRVKNLSQEALARMCGVAASTITRAEAGKGLTDRRKIHKALQGLGAPLEAPRPVAAVRRNAPAPSNVTAELFLESPKQAVEQAETLWGADLGQHLSERSLHTPAEQLSTPLLRWLVAPPAVLESTPDSPTNVTEDDVHAITRACDLFETLDHEFGGGHARTAAVQYLNSEIAPLLRGRFAPVVGRALFSASARFAAKTGAMAYDAGLHDLGRRYFFQALNLAHLGADRLFGAKALGLLSHQANFLGDFRSAVDFARTAKTGVGSRATPKVQAMLAAMEARGLASLGEERACTRALTEMEYAFSRGGTGQEPAWMGYFDASEIADEFAHCFHDLGRGALAIEHAQRSVALAPASFRRSRTFAGLVQADAHLMEGGRDLEAACTLAEQTIAHASRLRSARVRSYIARFQKGLEPYARARPVREFRSALAGSPLLQR
ncbi:helix-turn-helix domain-containing protein [Nocardiopsis terrae]